MADNLDEIFKGLSTDPHMASFELLQRVKSQILPTSPGEIEFSAACGVIEAFYDANGWKSPDRINPGGFSDKIDDAIARNRAGARLQFEAYQNQIMANYRAVMKTKALEALKGAMANTIGYAVLDGEEKKEIHKHIEKIRAIIQESALADGKKNSLFERLGELATEVNRNGTRTD